ncbi:hypothetical protein [Oscillibacter ruminantium]|uniref:hypothetical protein n=1 Tax=Oscillibacter ruminantium TaxID=1263547 RepID=UPI0002F0AA5A|nr:hypothetical protein [Oscillibacter ruminantium]
MKKLVRIISCTTPERRGFPSINFAFRKKGKFNRCVQRNWGSGWIHVGLAFACCICMVFLLSLKAYALNTRNQPLSSQSFINYAIGKDNVLYAWGEEYHSPDGRQPTSWEDAYPLLKNAAAVAAGWNGAMAIDMSGTLWGWGNYRLDNAVKLKLEEPYHIMEHTVDVATGLSHYLALSADGTLYGGGHNEQYQLTADGPSGSEFSDPVPILEGVQSIATDYNDASFAVLDNGELMFWGTLTDVQSPTPICLAKDVRKIFPGGYVLFRDGTLSFITEQKSLSGVKIILEPLLNSVENVFINAVQTEDGNFWLWSDEERQYQKVSIDAGVVYIFYSPDGLIIKTGDGDIRQVPMNAVTITKVQSGSSHANELDLWVISGSMIFIICAAMFRKRAVQ